jgi:hypothetical protein
MFALRPSVCEPDLQHREVNADTVARAHYGTSTPVTDKVSAITLSVAELTPFRMKPYRLAN